MRKITVVLALVFLVLGGYSYYQFIYDPSGASMVLVTDFEELAPAVAEEGDCPWWRGVNGDGKFGTQNVPHEWSPSQNLRWETEVPGRGHASPCVWQDRIFIFTADEDAKELFLLAYRRSDGGEIWKTELHSGGFMHTHPKNSQASQTPACDGERVYVPMIVDDSLRVWAVDTNGKEIWEKNLGPFNSTHGYGSSPILYKSFVIIVGDNKGTGFIAALHRKTGDLIWQTRRKSVPSFGAPVVAKLAGRDQLILHGAYRTTSYDPASGEEIWRCDGPTMTCASTIAFSDTHVFASGGYPDKVILAIRADGTGDVTDTHVDWQAKRGVAYVPSPLYHDGRLYVVNDDGIATCFDAESGKQLWKGRLPGGGVTASPVLVDGKIFVTNEAGTTHVFLPGDKLEIIASNDLDGSGMATLVACGGQVYLRGASALYCIGSDENTAPRTSSAGR